jgi:hypothetical protein
MNNVIKLYSSVQSPANLPQSPANLPSDRLWLRVSYCPGWQVISPPPPLGDQEGCSMEGKGQPQPAAWPRHPTPQLPGARRGGQAAATVLPPPPSKPVSRQHAPPPATILYEIFSTCVAKAIAAKLKYKTVGGKVETSLYCITATPVAAAVSVTPKKSRKRPDNKRRRMRREAWRQRFSTGAASAAAAPAAAVTSAQIVRPAAPGAATAAPATAAVTPHRAWAWESRDRLLVVARRLQEKTPEDSGVPRDSLWP